MASKDDLNADGIPSVSLLDESPVDTLLNDIDEALNEFRVKWQKELKIQHNSVQHSANPVPIVNEDVTVPPVVANVKCYASDKKSRMAESLFRDAVELEKRGKVYDAVPLYRKALQIDPNVELRFHEKQEGKISTNSEVNSANTVTDTKTDTLNENDFIEDLYAKFQLDISKEYGGKLILSNCDAGVISTELHFSDLPPEIIMYILRWAVSSQLDMHSLEQCAAVCKGLYICARDDDIWRLACMKVWGIKVGTLSNAPSNIANQKIEVDSNERVYPTYNSWRQMFIDRERVLFNGCYISKTKYLRIGENSFQDQFFQPILLVEYYRYIRFLPDGTVSMMTNADEPAQGVKKLRNMQQSSDVLRGRYQVNNGIVSVVLDNQPLDNQTPYGIAKQSNSSAFGKKHTEFEIEFGIVSTKKRKFTQLVWLSYNFVTFRNNTKHTSAFELTGAKYPPFWFSPVRSYHLDAEAPLS